MPEEVFCYICRGKVEICGVNTSKLAVLDSATTRRLLLRVRQGDKSAREELIAGNLRLVLSVIQHLVGIGWLTPSHAYEQRQPLERQPNSAVIPLLYSINS